MYNALSVRGYYWICSDCIEKLDCSGSAQCACGRYYRAHKMDKSMLTKVRELPVNAPPARDGDAEVPVNRSKAT
jgi:hypothetical protein